MLVVAAGRRKFDGAHTRQIHMRQPLDVIRAPEFRSVLVKALKPTLGELGFKPSKNEPGGWNGWVRETAGLREFFWIQLSRSGFDRYTGGKFIVEFTVSDAVRRTALRDRIWRLLDDVSRREAVRISNGTIAALPGPSREILNALPESLRSTYLGYFKTVDETPAQKQDVWFRYATRRDLTAWADFIASRFQLVIQECEQRLAGLQPHTNSMGGVALKARDDA